jgi:DNA-binding MurR/RpiR family transcriptional regulator
MNVLFSLSGYHTFTAGTGSVYHEVAGHVMDNLSDVPNLTTNELAERCFVSPSTIIRLCKNVGYNSFSAFKADVKNAIETFSYYNEYFPPTTGVADYISYLERMLAAITGAELGEAMDKAAEAMEAHKDVFIVDGEYSVEAQFLQICLALGGHHVECLTQLRAFDSLHGSIKRNSFICALRTDSSFANQSDKFLTYAKERGAEILLISNSNKGFDPKIVDHSISFPGEHMAIPDTMGLNILICLFVIHYRDKYLLGKK